ncbi:MAG: transporter substrate-binding domain-containing protein [Spirochaetales bacterium]|uniref:Transporter substrate-binding domain-containing protein n=1 Tax=Candidatus Thalassospirochaeta sargassi TaxID=3119039 RepID=A0AAJ1MPC4_9SPIO|nr:transporter substrate-binding domain-containing protein [Spirochaetales bacterium]
MTRRILLILLALGLFALPLFAGGQQEAAEPTVTEDSASLEKTTMDPRLYTPGKLTVATGEPAYPPWIMDDDPAAGVGFENGMVYALAEKLGFAKEDVVWVRQTFDQGIAPGAKPYDFNIQQYTVFEERKEFVDFSMVYYQPEKAVVALPGSGAESAKSFADLRELKWGATIGTGDLTYIEDMIGVEDVAVFNDQIGTIQALLGGQIDATCIELPTALFITAVQVPEATVAAILPSDPNDMGHGLIFEKGNPIVEWINEGLEAIIADGVVADLAKEYLYGGDDVPEISK